MEIIADLRDDLLVRPSDPQADKPSYLYPRYEGPTSSHIPSLDMIE